MKYNAGLSINTLNFITDGAQRALERNRMYNVRHGRVHNAPKPRSLNDKIRKIIFKINTTVIM